MDNILSPMPTDPFYPGLTSDADKATLRALPMWPLVTGIRAMSGNKLWCEYKSGNAVMYTEQGVSVLAIAHVNGTFRILLAASAMDNPNVDVEVLNSSSPAYILRRLAQIKKESTSKRVRKKDLDKAFNGGLANYLASEKFGPEPHLRQLLGHAVRDYNHRTGSVIIPRLGEATVSELLAAAIDGRAPNLEYLEAELITYKASRVLYAKACDQIDEAFEQEKWLVMLRPNGGLLVGAYKITPVINRERVAVIQPTNWDIKETVPVRLYKSVNDVDPAIFDNFRASLVMDKSMQQGNRYYGMDVRDNDPDKLIPINDGFAEDMSYASYCISGTYASRGHFYLFNKL